MLAINGFRLEGSFTGRLPQYDIGDRIELLISRDERLFSETVTLERRVTEDWSIGWVFNPSNEQSERIDSWLDIKPRKTDRKKRTSKKKESVGKTSDEAKKPEAKEKPRRRRKTPVKS